MSKKLIATCLPLADLTPNPRNPRRHAEAQLIHLQASLERFGQTRRILARKANKMIIAGHGIFEAANRCGMTEVEVLLWDVTQEIADAYMLADNRLSDLSDHDAGRVAELLDEIDPSDYMAVGYDPQDVSDLLEDVKNMSAISLEDFDTSQVYDDFWISVRGPLADQAVVLDRMKELLADHPNVSVQLGTIGN